MGGESSFARSVLGHGFFVALRFVVIEYLLNPALIPSWLESVFSSLCPLKVAANGDYVERVGAVDALVFFLVAGAGCTAPAAAP